MDRFVMLCGVLVLSASTAALADDATAPQATATTAAVQVAFQSIDRNGDHRISKTEAGSYKNLIDKFAVFDTDGDGFISESEFQAASSTQSFQ